MAVTTVTIDNFKTEVLDAKEPVLVDFWAEWCNPCRMLAPVVESLSGEYEGKARFCKVNIDEASDLAMTYGVMSIPTLVIFFRRAGERTRCWASKCREAACVYRRAVVILKDQNGEGIRAVGNVYALFIMLRSPTGKRKTTCLVTVATRRKEIRIAYASRWLPAIYFSQARRRPTCKWIRSSAH